MKTVFRTFLRATVSGALLAALTWGIAPVPGHAQYANGNGAMPFVAPAPAVPTPPPPGSLVTTANTYAADVLHSMLISRLNFSAPVLVASMVNLGNLDATSDLGRLASQQVGTRLAQYGMRVMDVRLRESMLVRRDGEFLLSRDARKLLQTYYNAKAAIVGAYTVADENVYFSVRAIDLTSGAILAGYEYFLPNQGEVRSLLASNSAVDKDALWRNFARRGQAFR